MRKENYRLERNKTTELVRKAKRDYEKALLNDIDLHCLFVISNLNVD